MYLSFPLLDFFISYFYFRPMIVKPPNWFCGIGIKLINKLGENNLSLLIFPPFFLLLSTHCCLRGDTKQEEQDVRPGVH